MARPATRPGQGPEGSKSGGKLPKMGNLQVPHQTHINPELEFYPLFKPFRRVPPDTPYMLPQGGKGVTGPNLPWRDVTMEPLHPKLARVNELIADGFDVDDVSSDHGAVDVWLTKDDVRTTIRISRREAAEILWGKPTRTARLLTPL